MGRVLFETDDLLSEDAIATALARANASDYVERGLAFSDLTSSDFQVSGGVAFVTHDNGRYTLEIDTQTVVLATQSGVNLIYATFDPGSDESQAVVAAESAGDFSDPKLKIGEVDAGQSTFDDTINRAPDATFVDLIAERVADSLDVQDLFDDATGNQLYDAGTETFGDGNQSADLESLSTADLKSNGLIRYVLDFEIPDDDVRTFDRKGKASSGIQKLEIVGDGLGGDFVVRFNSVTTIGADSITNEGSTDLTGTTGTDGNFSISCDNDTVHLENRTGGSVTVKVITEGII